MKTSTTKILVTMISLVFVIAFFPGMRSNAADEASGSCGTNVTWTLDSAGTLTISGTGAMTDWLTGGSPFSNISNIKKVVIEKGVTTVGAGAFYGCISLGSVTIPDSVQTIGNDAFSSCSGLESIKIPDSVTSIGECAFAYCSSLTSIKLPDNKDFKVIDTGLFMHCSSLKEITIPDSVTTIGESAFFYCSSFTSIEFPVNTIRIGSGALDKCSNLKNITLNRELQDRNKEVFNSVPSAALHFYYAIEYHAKGGGGNVSGHRITAGSSVETFSIRPYDGYQLDRVDWTDGGDPVTLTPDNNKYTMPDSDKGNVKLYFYFKTAEYDITFKNHDGTVLEAKKVKYGETPSYTGTATPTKESDGQYKYTFSGWSPEITTVTGDATYFAIYDKKEIKYKVVFVDIDGNEICSDEVGYLEVPVFNGKTPTKPESATSTFIFAGWNDGKTTYQLTESLPQIKADTTFKPMFKEVKKPVYTVGEVKGDGINSDIVIDVHRDSDDENCIDYFSGASVDGTAMTLGDQYTAEKGSTIITIKKDYLSTLTAGEHEVLITFKDGSISAKVTVATKANTSVPATGEGVNPATYIGAALIVAACACGAGVVLMKRRKEA